ncbi:MAG: hypothetical protein ACTIM4_13505 [Marinomonas sp.]
MEYTHLGWIPCINGHLDFCLIKPTLGGSFTRNKEKDNNKININYSHQYRNNLHHSKRFMMQSKVDWKDTDESRLDGTFRVFLVAESKHSDLLDARDLCGDIFLYQASKIESEVLDERKKLPQFELIHEAKDIFEKYKKNKTDLNWEDTVKKLDDIYYSLKSNLESDESIYKVSFESTANGLTLLTLNSKQELTEESSYTIIRQAFYYLKYSLHDHKHHDSQQDSLTTIIEYKDDATGKKNAALKMIGQLKRELTTIKRSYSSGEKSQTTDAQGVISYLNSLIETCFYEDFLDKKTYQREKEYLKSVSSSFTAQTKKIESISSIEEKIKSRNRVVFGWTLSLIGMFFLFSSRNYLKENEKLKTIVFNFDFTEFFFIFFSFSIALYLSYKVFTEFEINVTQKNEGFYKLVSDYYKISKSNFYKKIMKEYFYLIILSLLNLLIGIFLLENSGLIDIL